MSQVEYTLRAGHIGQGYMTHDIGGHMHDFKALDPGMYCRWLQWGVLSPLFRLHSSAGGERRPYHYEERALTCARVALKIRMDLLPYLYTLARETADTGMPICRSNFLELPDWEKGYGIWDAYFLGDRIYAAPILTAGNTRQVTLPPGGWYRHGESRLIRSDGERELAILAYLEAPPPHFHKAGTLLVKQPFSRRAADIPAELVVELFAGPGPCSDEFLLYEDDGMSQHWKSGRKARTRFALNQEAQRAVIEVGAVDGGYDGMPESREHEIRVIGGSWSRAVLHRAGRTPRTFELAEGEGPRTVRIEAVPLAEGFRFEFH